jgi:hypothetical protein
MPEYGYLGHPMKSLRTPQDHLRTTSGPPQDHHATRYLIDTHRKLLHNCHTLRDIQKKWDIP